MVIKNLTPASYNPRKISDEKLTALEKAMVEFGDLSGIVFNVNTGRLVGGHQRIKTLDDRFTITKEEHTDDAGTVALGYIEAGDNKWSYREVDWDEAKEKAANIAANKHGGEWDMPKLEELILELDHLNYDLELTGFDNTELEDLFDWPEEKQEYNEDADEVPEVEENPVIKRGDLIELGHDFQHRLLCGDSTSEDDVKRLMDGKKADMVFTDPPYGVSYSNNMNDKHDVIKNDDVFLDEWIPLVQQHSRGFIFMWTSYQVLSEWLQITKPFGKLSNMVIWSKGGGGLGDLKGAFATDYEIALVWNRKATLQDKRIGSVWSVSKDGGASYVHPTQKPVELMEKGIFNCSKTNNIVMDLFLGSGSTLIASENLTRKCYGMELDEKYAQVIIQRYVDYTSNPMIKINGIECDWNSYKGSL